MHRIHQSTGVSDLEQVVPLRPELEGRIAPEPDVPAEPQRGGPRARSIWKDLDLRRAVEPHAMWSLDPEPAALTGELESQPLHPRKEARPVPELANRPRDRPHEPAGRASRAACGTPSPPMATRWRARRRSASRERGRGGWAGPYGSAYGRVERTISNPAANTIWRWPAAFGIHHWHRLSAPFSSASARLRWRRLRPSRICSEERNHSRQTLRMDSSARSGSRRWRRREPQTTTSKVPIASGASS